jgi:hypothetical protein
MAADCLQALQDCSLIGLEESPQLLRQSMFASTVRGRTQGAPGALNTSLVPVLQQPPRTAPR